MEMLSMSTKSFSIIGDIMVISCSSWYRFNATIFLFNTLKVNLNNCSIRMCNNSLHNTVFKLIKS